MATSPAASAAHHKHDSDCAFHYISRNADRRTTNRGPLLKQGACYVLLGRSRLQPTERVRLIDADLDELGADRSAARTTPSKTVDIVLAFSLALMVAVIGAAALIASADYLLRLLGH